MTHEQDISDLLRTYERSLNDSDADLAASCYARDGVFMPTGQPTATADTIRDAYSRIPCGTRVAHLSSGCLLSACPTHRRRRRSIADKSLSGHGRGQPRGPRQWRRAQTWHVSIRSNISVLS
jgi:hypothetical protein